MRHKVYWFQRGHGGDCKVTVNVGKLQVPLAPRFDLRNHSPAGFNWGYSGSGPAQLSLALMADLLGNDEAALEIYQDFKFRWTARQHSDVFMVNAGDLYDVIGDLICNLGASVNPDRDEE